MASSKKQFNVNYNKEDQVRKERISIAIKISPELRKHLKLAAERRTNTRVRYSTL
jgi:hypothetical protein